jgi:phospholipid/cholesterol/gamma-HCH transport system substrate-binding protein
MATRSVAEVATGAAVLVLAGGFLVYALIHTGVGGGGYHLTAKFSDITGLGTGADVRIGGVKVGTVADETLDPTTYQAVVTLSIDPSVKIPKDSSAVISTESLLGGDYVALQPGGDAQMLGPDGVITATQSAVNLMSLVGKFIFNGSGSGSGAGSAKPPPSAPAGGSGGP